MNRISILILEDQPLHAAKLEILLEEMEYHVLPPVDNAAEARRLFNASQPDLLILDITVKGEEDGVEFAENLRSANGSRIPVIYLTSHKDNSTFDRAKKTAPQAYLNKPIDRFSLQHAIELALMKTMDNEQERANKVLEGALKNGNNLFIKEQKKLFKVAVKDIEVLEVDGRYCKLFVGNRRFMVRASLTQMLKNLPDSLFLQTHRNFLVNMNAITEIELENSIIYTPNREVPISKNYKGMIINNLNFLK